MCACACAFGYTVAHLRNKALLSLLRMQEAFLHSEQNRRNPLFTYITFVELTALLYFSFLYQWGEEKVDRVESHVDNEEMRGTGTEMSLSIRFSEES